MLQRLWLGPSGVHGWGGFVKEPIKKHQFIHEYVGEVIQNIHCPFCVCRSSNKRCVPRRSLSKKPSGVAECTMYRCACVDVRVRCRLSFVTLTICTRQHSAVLVLVAYRGCRSCSTCRTSQSSMQLEKETKPRCCYEFRCFLSIGFR
jgi:hypothetical protein